MMSSSAMGLSSTFSAASSSSMSGCHYIKYKYNNINYMKKNNNYVILILFIVIICYILFIFMTEKRERFTLMDKGIGEYQYLAPIPEYNTWSDTTVDKFITKYKEVTGQELEKKFINYWFNFTLEDEATYYISNGIFPICTYMINYCNNEPSTLQKFGLVPSGNPVTLQLLQKFQPNRYWFMIIIYPIQYNLDPQPDATLIYLGKKEPPTYNNDIMSNVMSYFG